ncbi:MAG: beta-galactosidase GalA [Mangrovibacterium sp.]
MMKKQITIVAFCLLALSSMQAQSARTRVNFDDNWRFAFGHPFDKDKDFGTGTAYFTYLSKARYGADGAAKAEFDDRSWRPLDLPHDWAVEMPFSKEASHSHGYKTVGPGFPDVSVGWYRKHFFVEQDQLGKQTFIEFDGVMRDAEVWVNGHYLGKESSGYQSFSHNISDILNYGDDNVVAVRCDVSMEEGWYYEGAGIYRHVWLTTTENIHVVKDGTFVRTTVEENAATIEVDFEVENRNIKTTAFTATIELLDDKGEVVAQANANLMTLAALGKETFSESMTLHNPTLWDLKIPYLYVQRVKLFHEGKLIDQYDTRIGIRTIEFIADKGFFLNGKHVKLKGTNNHQDHAGVGAAIPDELNRWRLQQLKNFGNNAIRSSHNPPTPELLDLCDEMGILVIDENRLMGTTDKALAELERLIKRDRNHPSIILWSIGNEEWGIEWNEVGARMTQTMQSYANLLDPTRKANVAISGGWDTGSGSVVEVMGYNYLIHGDTDEHIKKFPWQPSVGTEEGSTYATRGIYETQTELNYHTAYDVRPLPDWPSLHESWKHYDTRDYRAGMFIWTGFDYRGEPTPYKFPSVTSYFGMMDLCGFPKDNVYYLKSQWQDEPVLHILPHWNHADGDTIDLWVYSNVEEVELKVNGKSLGKQTVPKYDHAAWKVPYQQGRVEAIGYRDGKKVMQTSQCTASTPTKINLTASKTTLLADNKDVAIVSVEVIDKRGVHHPTANNQINFELIGNGKIIGIGNGDPTSLEKEQFVADYQQVYFSDASIFELSEADKQLLQQHNKEGVKAMKLKFDLTRVDDEMTFKWFYNTVGMRQRLFINGEFQQVVEDGEKPGIVVNPKVLKVGENEICIYAVPLKPANQWDEPNKKPGSLQLITRNDDWQRKLFNGWAQVLVQSTAESGELILKASSPDLQSTEIKFSTIK